MDAATSFALVAAAHAGFQVTVTALVYPALAVVPPERWTAAHAAHSRRIAPIVVVVYGALVLAGAWYATDEAGLLGWLAILFSTLTLVVTAAAAAPLHGRLTADDPRLVARLKSLLRIDQVRCATAVVGAVAAVAALST